MMKAEEKFLAGYDKYASAILRHIFFRVSDQTLAEDLAQETFFKAWRHIAKTGEEIKNFKTFFYKIADNLIIDHYRRKSRKEFPLEDVGENELAVSAPQEKEAEGTANKNLIEKYLKEIGDDYRQALICRYIDDLSIKEISEITGKSANNISVMIHRALKMLREKYDKRI
ncbi:RNA polymerase sigma factor [Candidatus Falkowbacteria bacterium]|nr:RNA polymerase sigma factor [Candidatus Falkowbacteria bacterium]